MAKKVLIISTSLRGGSNSEILANECAEGAKEALARYIEAVKEYNTSLSRKSNDKDDIEIVIAE